MFVVLVARDDGTLGGFKLLTLLATARRVRLHQFAVALRVRAVSRESARWAAVHSSDGAGAESVGGVRAV